MLEMWGTMKRPGIEKEKNNLDKGTENIFNIIIEENFPNIKTGVPVKVQNTIFPSLNQK